MRQTLQQALLYGIVDLGYTKINAVEITTKQLLAGGAGIIQLRAKNVDIALIETVAKQIQPLCKKARIPFIINDHKELAATLGADGLHIGQDDGNIEEARAIVGENMIIGRSTHSLLQAQQAVRDGFDYIGFGPLFPTPTKQGRAGIGIDDIHMMERLVGSQIPAFCIGGIKIDNLSSIVKAGARRAVIVSELLLSSDISSTAQSALNILKQTTHTS